MEPSNSLAGKVLAVLFVLLPTMAVMAPIQIPYFLAVGGIIGLISHACRVRAMGGHSHWPTEWDRPLVALLVLFVAYAALSALWSLDSGASLKLALRLALLALATLGFAILCGHAFGSRRVQKGALIGLFLGAVFLGIEIVSGGAIREGIEALLGLERFHPRTVLEQRLEYSRTAPAAVLLVWPLVLWAGIGGDLTGWRRKTAWFLTAAGMIALALSVIPNGAAKLAFLTAVVAVPVALLIGARRMMLVMITAAILLALSAPFIASRLDSPDVLRHLVHKDAPMAQRGGYSLMHRLKIWGFAADRALEKPFTGWGLDASRRIPGGQDPIVPADLGLPRDEVLPDVLKRMEIRLKNDYRLKFLRLHPHNAALQVWLELGLVGVVLLLVILGRAIWLVSRRSEPHAVPVLAGGIVLASLSFGIWQGWWLAVLLLAGCLTQGLRRAEQEP